MARFAQRRDHILAGTNSPIAGEQRYLDRLYRRLDALRAQAGKRLAAVKASRAGGSPQNRSERDAFATLHADRLAQLESVEDRLVFGSLTMDDSDHRHIGRIGLQGENLEPLLTDWRAPAAEPFYQATPNHRLGVARRRHITTAGRRVTAVEDELLDLEAASGMADSQAAELTGEGALMAALAAGRTGRMNDIVATIQAEQDRIIRSQLNGALVVQGGPGTGKTAVALHRAAYLLYTHRDRLANSGVLVVGPSRIFLRYIDRVLPSLGETGVVATTMAELVPGFAATATDRPEVAAIKGRLEMAKVIRRAVKERQRLPRRAIALPVLGRDLVLRRSDVAQARHIARATSKPYNLARQVFVRELLNRLARQFAEQSGTDPNSADLAEVTEDLRSARDVRVAINLCWMPMTPRRLIEDLYAKPHLLDYCAPELAPPERSALARPLGSAWTVSDVPLIDEAAELLGEDDAAAQAELRHAALQQRQNVEYAGLVLAQQGSAGLVSAEQLADRFATAGPSLTIAERASSDRAWTYGHIVVDEAQELTPMDWRSLLRRCPTRSLTIVGDSGQTRAPGATGSWNASLDQVLGQGNWRIEELTVNYRTPAAVVLAAQDLARRAGLPVGHDVAARDIPNSLMECSAADLVGEAVALARRRLPQGDTGRVAVIASGPDLAAIRQAVEQSDLASKTARPDENPLDFPLSILDPPQVKGLEFDEVIIVDPAAVAAAAGTATDYGRRTGAADLYVAMTRPTRRLWLVRPAPSATGGDER
ncbi:MAG: AAA family ATPase [Bifidobacteriaceae bacterium]|jgi:DNA helicase IV|nr:AAA family ATPase [Bifidobacteriaceae bacterium]